MNQGRCLGRTATFVLAMAVLGCGLTAKPVKVEGIVTQDGKPIQNAMVVFHPEGGGRSATGLTDSEGVFQLTTINTGDGAMPGAYKVTVEKVAPAKQTGPVSPEDPASMQKAYGAFLKEAGRGAKPPQTTLNPIYGLEDKTPLKFTVPVDGRVEIKLNK
jgi:hypothetical protein